jgi:hypothetical protein
VSLEAVKIDLHRRLALAGSVSDLRELRAEVVDRFGPLPDPVENLFGIHEARMLAGELGAEVVVVRGAKLTVSPLRMDSAQVREMKQRVPQAIYSVAAREVSSKLELQPNSNGRPNMREGLEVLAAIIESRPPDSGVTCFYESFRIILPLYCSPRSPFPRPVAVTAAAVRAPRWRATTSPWSAIRTSPRISSTSWSPSR